MQLVARGIAATAFIDDLFPNPMTLRLRNAPAVFGSGYAQAVANEMTAELMGRAALLRAEARTRHDHKARGQLTAKGISFGYHVVRNGYGIIAGAPTQVIIGLMELRVMVGLA